MLDPLPLTDIFCKENEMNEVNKNENLFKIVSFTSLCAQLDGTKNRRNIKKQLNSQNGHYLFILGFKTSFINPSFVYNSSFFFFFVFFFLKALTEIILSDVKKTNVFTTFVDTEDKDEVSSLSFDFSFLKKHIFMFLMISCLKGVS